MSLILLKNFGDLPSYYYYGQGLNIVPRAVGEIEIDKKLRWVAYLAQEHTELERPKVAILLRYIREQCSKMGRSSVESRGDCCWKRKIIANALNGEG